MIRGCDIPLLPSGQAAIETMVRAVLQQDTEIAGEVTIVCSRPPRL